MPDLMPESDTQTHNCTDTLPLHNSAFTETYGDYQYYSLHTSASSLPQIATSFIKAQKIMDCKQLFNHAASQHGTCNAGLPASLPRTLAGLVPLISTSTTSPMTSTIQQVNIHVCEAFEDSYRHTSAQASAITSTSCARGHHPLQPLLGPATQLAAGSGALSTLMIAGAFCRGRWKRLLLGIPLSWRKWVGGEAGSAAAAGSSGGRLPCCAPARRDAFPASEAAARRAVLIKLPLL